MNFARYMSRRPWDCPSCGKEQEWAGHRCQWCKRRICCACFHHDTGMCLSNTGSDVAPPDGVTVGSCDAAASAEGRV